MEKDRLYCFGNTRDVGMLLNKQGYFGDSEEEIQQQIDSGASVKECERIDMGVNYCVFYPHLEVNENGPAVCTPSYKYFYCVDKLNSLYAKDYIKMPGYEAPLYDMQLYCTQQFNAIKFTDCVSMQAIYDYAGTIADISNTAKQLHDDMSYWYSSKQNQLREFLVSELNSEEYIDSNVLRTYADKLDAVDNLSCGDPDFNEIQEMLDEYNL